MSLLSRFSCPFCFETYTLREVQYACSAGNVSQPAPREREPIACKHKPACTCDGLATLRQCPKCGAVIPQIFLETEFLPFSILGDQGSGKTTYITVVMKELEDAAGDLQLSLSHQSDDTIMKMEEDRARIYRDGAKLDMTNIGQPVPQVWRVTNNTRRRHNTYNFTIFDGAGEIIRNIGRYPLEVRYIKASRAILLLLDPLRLQNLIANGGIWPEDAKNSHTAQIDDVYRDTRNAGAIVTAIADAICVARGMRKTRLDIPTAVVITKFDLLDHRLPAGSLVTSYGSIFRDGRVDLQACSQMDREIVAWLTAERETAFLEAVRSSFSNFTFFGVSNFGKPPPDEYSAPAGITPRRVLDPMLWLFHKLGFIDGGR